jgi:hypothetical protein
MTVFVILIALIGPFVPNPGHRGGRGEGAGVVDSQHRTR